MTSVVKTKLRTSWLTPSKTSCNDVVACTLHRADFNLLICRVEGFGSPSDGKIFFNGIMTHIPPRILDLMIYLPSSGLKFLMEHVRLSNSIAEELIDSKKHALEEGKGGKDVLTLIRTRNLALSSYIS